MLDEYFIEGDSQVTATLTPGSGGYRLDVDGTFRNEEDVTYKVVQEGDNDLLALVAGGQEFTNVAIGVTFYDSSNTDTDGDET